MNKFEQKVNEYIEQKEKSSVNSEIIESLETLGLETKLTDRLRSDKKMLDYANLFLKESLNAGKKRSFNEEIKMLKLEVQLKLTCSYFEDFKIFLSDLKDNEGASSDLDSSEKLEEEYSSSDSKEVVASTFAGISLSQIKSNPFYKSSKSDVTWCSATARFNAYNFGLNDFPRGDAYQAGTKQGDGVLDTIPASKKNNKPSNKWPNISFNEFTSINSNDKANFADIYTDSRSTYGHRVVGFKASDGQWYVLDPYNNVNGLNDKPKKLQDYMTKKGIKKVHFYESKRYEYKEYKARVD